MKILIDIPNREVPEHQGIIDVRISFIDGTVSQCNYPFEEILSKEKGYECAAPKGMLVGYGYCNGVCEECEYGKLIEEESEK